MLKKLLLATALAPLLTIADSGPADAATRARQWFEGVWANCRIDGRPARMAWRVRNIDTGSCNGDTCTSVANFEYVGQFSDNGGGWVPLTYVSSNSAVLNLRHADGNSWQLRRQGNSAVGYTTWNGQRYPLSCNR